MKIAVDMDNVLTDFSNHVVHIMEQEYDLHFKSYYKCNTWDMSSWGLNEEDSPEKIDRILHDLMYNVEGFWRNLPIINGAIDGLNYLHNKHEVIIVTYPQWDSVYCVNEKVAWLKWYFPFIDIKKQLIMTDRKELLDVQYLIDDKPEYIKNFSQKRVGNHGIIYDYPYNIDLDCTVPHNFYIGNTYRVYNWNDIMRIL